MQEPRPLPNLGEGFAALCDQSVESCLRRVLSVEAQRAQMYNALVSKHGDLVEFIKRADRDDDSDPL